MNIPRFALTLAAAGILAACSSSPKTGDEQSGAAVEDRSGAASSGIDSSRVVPVTPGDAAGAGIAALKDPKSILSKRSVYFDYDSYVVKDEFRALVEAHAKFLVGHPQMKMLIQGNTDERGSREYNLALGQKRSEAVKKALSLLGVPESQLESVSLGKEKPSCSDATETCWSANRRGDMLYSGEF
ncbi:MAG TPA: peptidoglycan-associated lipoprotein Pal [Zoogloea sp.]|uniref:peptidoglycan-associated lipoprotein Pal n=1 Tax=Zoogloea sp. TaxID=49181 RepID=UPI002B545E2C|nr:peptidoglycan-associated lipoprotein Pal [Zoogloea sp.]HMV19087.1 peptidoglycan-associated lipoprotein Pal [Rhodocyclaceae bacterium]HMV64554.1 peptidoglycan-associated lipoprotein Pal [Rhodocyclaceae bacterium]HMW53452.1 peptidoglycan-associated lipoprotein Pal [Rhodocyclaceae bacterium]HMY51060.1 peptidoglycan-associated lipoprotein Pal [Rhodocyclaceae bacterium]HMZ76478.1 peptidoglycan-associated lipoprotein Pal [Rhodocyclaceae bacterium]